MRSGWWATVAWAAYVVPLGSLLPAADVAAQASSPVASQVDTAPTLAELNALRSALASDESTQRERGFQALRSLGADALPAIARRLEAIAAEGFDPAAVLTAMSELRRVQGVDAPDGDVDLAEGALAVLAKTRDRATVLSAELMALVRALEGQRTPEAAELLVGRLFALDSKLFRYEAQRSRTRLGVLLLPALIRHENHPKAWIRAFCQETLLSMRVDKPGRAVQQDDVALLSAILLAYGATLNFSAMPVVVSYVTDERLEVREAARTATARFGKNAIWQLRERYLNSTGDEADPRWSHQRLLAELLRMVEAPKSAAFEQKLAAASAALDDGKFEAAQGALDGALLEVPRGELSGRAAPLYERLAAHFESMEAPERALSALRRALRLAPASDTAHRLRARIDYLEASSRLAHGQADVLAYERAIALDPSLAEARETLSELTGERSRREQQRRRAVGLGAAALLVVAAFMVLRGTRKQPREAESGTPQEDVENTQSG